MKPELRKHIIHRLLHTVVAGKDSVGFSMQEILDAARQVGAHVMGDDYRPVVAFSDLGKNGPHIAFTKDWFSGEEVYFISLVDMGGTGTFRSVSDASREELNTIRRVVKDRYMALQDMHHFLEILSRREMVAALLEAHAGSAEDNTVVGRLTRWLSLVKMSVLCSGLPSMVAKYIQDNYTITITTPSGECPGEFVWRYGSPLHLLACDGEVIYYENLIEKCWEKGANLLNPESVRQFVEEWVKEKGIQDEEELTEEQFEQLKNEVKEAFMEYWKENVVIPFAEKFLERAGDNWRVKITKKT